MHGVFNMRIEFIDLSIVQQKFFFNWPSKNTAELYITKRFTMMTNIQKYEKNKTEGNTREVLRKLQNQCVLEKIIQKKEIHHINSGNIHISVKLNEMVKKLVILRVYVCVERIGVSWRRPPLMYE